MAFPEFTMKQLLEAGVHFGHHTHRWNPKMREYIFGVRNGVHIMDLQQTQPMLQTALKAMRDIVAQGGRVLFVGTKRQAQDKVAESAKRCGQYFVNKRWLGGMMTNWNTMSKSIARLRELEGMLASEETQSAYTKKELLMMTRERAKLELFLGGIKDMGGQPDAIFVIDTNQEDIAIKEANKLGVPVFAIVDSNAVPDGVDYVIPGNDDALRAIDLYCDLFADAVLDGLQAELSKSGTDIGADPNASEDLTKAKAPKKDAKAKAQKTEKAEAKDADAKVEKPEKAAAPAEKSDATSDAEDVKKQATA